MRKLVALFVVIFIIVSLTVNMSNSNERTWLARDWLTKGNGWAEKGVIRTSGNDKGRLLFGITSDAGGSFYIVSVDIKAELNISRFNIEAWDFSEITTFNVPIPIPEAEPTVKKPFEISIKLPNTEKLGNASYELSIESSSNGKMKLKGELKESGGIEFSLENVLWQKGTAEPKDPDNESGCNSVFGFAALLLIIFSVSMHYVYVNVQYYRKD